MSRFQHKRALFFFVCAGVFFFHALVFALDIAIFGDSQHNPAVTEQVVQAILSRKPGIVFRVGDIVDDGRDATQWEQFRAINAKLLKTTEYYPVLGNHEGASALYFENFPRIYNLFWYSVERENVHFIALDSNTDLSVGSEQYQWLLSDLENVSKDARFILVFFHHPILSVGCMNADEKKLGAALLPLFEKYGVSAVFSGHDHNYQRFLHNGITYIVTGGGGSSLCNRVRSSSELLMFAQSYHYCWLSSEGSALKGTVFDPDNAVLDEFFISPRIAKKN